MNVHELDDAGRFQMGWCFLPEGYLVRGDVMLAQKIALETSEIRALSVAVKFVPNERLGAAVGVILSVTLINVTALVGALVLLVGGFVS
jgi:hypothetical protein